MARRCGYALKRRDGMQIPILSRSCKSMFNTVEYNVVKWECALNKKKIIPAPPTNNSGGFKVVRQTRVARKLRKTQREVAKVTTPRGLSSGYKSAADKAVKGGSYKHCALFSFLLQIFIISTFPVLCVFYEVYFNKGEQTSISYRRKLTKRGLIFGPVGSR